MNRAKLWTFYQFMSWASLFKPSVGLEMIEAAWEGKAKMDQADLMKAIFGRAQVDNPKERKVDE